MGYDTFAPTATIANGASLSGAIDLTNNSLVGVLMPAAWTAASLSFAVSFDGTTYYPLYIVSSTLAAAEYAITSPAAATAIAIDPALFCGWRYAKLRSGTSGAAVNQNADRVMTIISRQV